MTNHTAALAALIAQVQPGWTVDHTDYDYSAHSGRHVVKAVSDRMYGEDRAGYTSVRTPGSSGPAESYYLWPQEGDDFEVDGLTLRIYNPSHAYVHGRRAITHEFRYAPPRP